MWCLVMVDDNRGWLVMSNVGLMIEDQLAVLCSDLGNVMWRNMQLQTVSIVAVDDGEWEITMLFDKYVVITDVIVFLWYVHWTYLV